MANNPLHVRELVAAYKYRVFVGSEKALEKEIINPDAIVPGLELIGFYYNFNPTSGIVLGEKECVFISKLPEDKQKECFEYLTNEKTPFIVIGDNYPCPAGLEKVARAKDFVILLDDNKAPVISFDIYSFAISKLARQKLLHGTLVSVYGSGLLLRGPSGIGKSEIALELIRRGHRLIADDSVLVYRREHHLYGKAPEHQKNLLEVRGLGIIDVYRLFGITAVSENSELNYIIDLVTPEEAKKGNRLSDALHYEEVIGLKIPTVKLPVSTGRNMADIVEVAAMTLNDRTMGHNATKEFMENYDKLAQGEKSK